ncbi:MAG: response regulator [Gemmatimonadales bacterium]
MSDPIRVLVADDHALVREGIRHVLMGQPGFEVVAEAGSAAEVLELAGRHRPDVILLDISMPGAHRLEVAAELRRRVPVSQILILSVHDHPEYVLESVRAGAQGYLKKDTAPNELRNAVRAVARGEGFFSPSVARQLSLALQGQTERTEQQERLEQLTGRERDVLLGIVNGETNKEIAARLGISPRTVETHRESLMRKLEIRTVAGLTRFAVDSGLLEKA